MLESLYAADDVNSISLKHDSRSVAGIVDAVWTEISYGLCVSLSGICEGALSCDCDAFSSVCAEQNSSPSSFLFFWKLISEGGIYNDMNTSLDNAFVRSTNGGGFDFGFDLSRKCQLLSYIDSFPIFSEKKRKKRALYTQNRRNALFYSPDAVFVGIFFMASRIFRVARRTGGMVDVQLGFL